MKNSQISAIALMFSTFFAGQAMAADVPTPAGAFDMVTESGRLAKDVFANNYPAPQLESLSRAQVRTELNDAIAKGNVIVTESGQRANEVFSANYSNPKGITKSREEVHTELVEAIEKGLLDQHISA